MTCSPTRAPGRPGPVESAPVMTGKLMSSVEMAEAHCTPARPGTASTQPAFSTSTGTTRVPAAGTTARVACTLTVKDWPAGRSMRTQLMVMPGLPPTGENGGSK